MKKGIIAMLVAALAFAVFPADAAPKKTKKSKKAKTEQVSKKEKQEETPTEEAKDEKAKVPFKVCKSRREAEALAKKHNLLMWGIFSVPNACPACKQFERDVLASKELKEGLAGMVVAYISTSPIPGSACPTMRPHSVLMKPNGEKVVDFNLRGFGPDEHISQATRYYRRAFGGIPNTQPMRPEDKPNPFTEREKYRPMTPEEMERLSPRG